MRIRIVAWGFSGIFALGTALIGFPLSKAYLTYLNNSNTPPGVPASYTPPEWYGVVAPILFIALFGIVGFLIGSVLFHRISDIGRNLRRIPAEDKIASTIGTLIALVLVFMFANIIVKWDQPEIVKFAIILLMTVLLIWLGNVFMFSMKDELKYLVPGTNRDSMNTMSAALEGSVGATPKLLDTNVIIDGRIYDICRAGFLEGPIILPGFILEELQHIADSADSLRRNRGRRGLDILHQMQTELENILRLVDRYKVNFAPGDEVDIKLVKMAKAMNADIVTNDFNLNKVAKLHGVRVLNVNELANAVKPIVLPGEELHVTIVREGKEYNQGVGYLDDGTMVVVENGKKMLGDSVTVAVASVLQTVAGKMIFAELKFDNNHTEDSDEHGNYYSSRGNRRKTL